MKARVSNLAKTETEWLKLNFKPLPGEVVVYLPENADDCVRIKIGDGVHNLHALPFIIEHIAEDILTSYTHNEELDAYRITKYF